ncbi:MAG TPA: hypothetical protein VJL90_03600 [Pseudorhodoplanes sp.]|nr:hypothetical protein [Pseudorhodoplanes sp.]
MALTLHDQVERLVNENQALRVKSENDDKLIHLLKEQYNSLAAQVKGIREDAIREVERARHQRDADVSAAEIERDQAQVAYKEIDGLLLQVCDTITQAARARIGNATPEKMQSRPMPAIEDGRLPPPSI